MFKIVQFYREYSIEIFFPDKHIFETGRENVRRRNKINTNSITWLRSRLPRTLLTKDLTPQII